MLLSYLVTYFLSNLVREVLRTSNVAHNLTTAFYPWKTGMAWQFSLALPDIFRIYLFIKETYGHGLSLRWDCCHDTGVKKKSEFSPFFSSATAKCILHYWLLFHKRMSRYHSYFYLQAFRARRNAASWLICVLLRLEKNQYNYTIKLILLLLIPQIVLLGPRHVTANWLLLRVISPSAFYAEPPMQSHGDNAHTHRKCFRGK